MKKKLMLILAATAVLATGCATSHKVTITQDPTSGAFSTNTTVVVNEVNLALDCVAAQGATAIAVNVVLVQTKHDPNVVQALKNAKIAMDGILNGSNQQTTAQVLALLKAQGNQALTDQVTQLVDTVSKLEQGLLQKYGTTVAGEISLSLLKAVDAGLTIGLGVTS